MAQNAEVTHALPPGSEIKDCRVERASAATELALTYLAKEAETGKTVAIQEYFPTDFAQREENGGVSGRSKSRESSFQWGLERFVIQARKISLFNHPGLAGVQRVFQARGTAYAVLDHPPGESLEDKLGKGPVSEDVLRAIIEPVMGGLALIHGANVVHGDVRPENLIIGDDGRAVLTGYTLTPPELVRQRQTGSSSAPHYSALELLSSTTQPGPQADIYSLGAVMYHALTGKLPPTSLERAVDDTLIPALTAAAGRAGTGFLGAIDRALAVKTSERPLNISEFWELLDREEEAVDAKDDVQAQRTKSGLNSKLNIFMHGLRQSSKGKKKMGLLAQLGHSVGSVIANVAHGVRRQIRRKLGLPELISGIRTGVRDKWKQKSKKSAAASSSAPRQSQVKRSLEKLAEKSNQSSRRKQIANKGYRKSGRKNQGMDRIRMSKGGERKSAPQERKKSRTRVGVMLPLVGSVGLLYLLWDSDITKNFQGSKSSARGITVSLKKSPRTNSDSALRNPLRQASGNRPSGFSPKSAERRRLRNPRAKARDAATADASTAAKGSSDPAAGNNPANGAANGAGGEPDVAGGSPEAGETGWVQGLLQGITEPNTGKGGSPSAGRQPDRPKSSSSRAQRRKKATMNRRRYTAGTSNSRSMAATPAAANSGGTTALPRSYSGPISPTPPTGQGDGGASRNEGKAGARAKVEAQSGQAGGAPQNPGSSLASGEKSGQALTQGGGAPGQQKIQQPTTGSAAPRTAAQASLSRNMPSPNRGGSLAGTPSPMASHQASLRGKQGQPASSTSQNMANLGGPQASGQMTRDKSSIDQAKPSQQTSRHAPSAASLAPGSTNQNNSGTRLPSPALKSEAQNLSSAKSKAEGTGIEGIQNSPSGPNDLGLARGGENHPNAASSGSQSMALDAGGTRVSHQRQSSGNISGPTRADQTLQSNATIEAARASPQQGGTLITHQAGALKSNREIVALKPNRAAGADRRRASGKSAKADSQGFGDGGAFPGAAERNRLSGDNTLFQALGNFDSFGPNVRRSRLAKGTILDSGDADVKRRFEAIRKKGADAKAAAYNPDLLVAKTPADMARAFNNLAGLYHETGDTAAAENLYRRAIDLWEKTGDKNAELVATGFNNLAELYRIQGRQDQAAPLFKRAIDILSAPGKAPSPGLAVALQNLALIHHRQRDTKRAEQLYRKALDVAQGMGPAGANAARAARKNYAILLRNMGRTEEAAEIEAAN